VIHLRSLLLVLLSFALLSSLFIRLWWVDSQFGAGLSAGSIIWRAVPLMIVTVGALLAAISSGGQVLSRLSSAERRMIASALTVFVLSICVGLAFFNSARYIFSDALRYLAPWATLFLVASTARYSCSGKPDRRTRNFIYFFLALSLADALITIYFAVKFPWARISNVMFIFAACWALFADKNKAVIIRMVVLVICILAVAVSGKRGTYLGFGLVALMFVLVELLQVRKFVRNAGLYSIGIVLVTIMASLLSAEALVFISDVTSEVIAVSSKLSDMLSASEMDATVEGRYFEFLNVLEYWAVHPLAVFSGAGFGAEVPMIYSTGVYSADGMMHHAHSTWLVYLWRNGLPGVMLLVFFFGVCMLRTFRLVVERKPSLGLACGAFAVFMLAMSGKSHVMLEDLSLPIAAALLLGVTRSRGDQARVNGTPCA